MNRVGVVSLRNPRERGSCSEAFRLETECCEIGGAKFCAMLTELCGAKRTENNQDQVANKDSVESGA